MKKQKKFEVYADLIDSPERLSALIEDRRKRRKTIQVCFAILAVSTLVTVVISFGSGGNSVTSLAVLAIFLGVYLGFEFEWQLLHILKRLTGEHAKPADSDNPG